MERNATRHVVTIVPAVPIAKTVKRLRIAAKMTQMQLAQRLGMKVMAISNIERMLTVPRLTTAVALANVFRISVDALISGAEASAEFVPLSMPTAAELGAAIRRRRESVGMPQTELAQKASVGASDVFAWEGGTRLSLSEPLYRVARTLGITVDDLFIKC